MSNVTVTDIRRALGKLDSDGVDDTTVQAHIDMAEDIVTATVTDPDRVADATRRIAIIDIAKYRVFTSNRQAFIRSIKSSMDTTEFDVDGKVESLRQDYEDALALLQQDDRPTVVTLGDR